VNHGLAFFFITCILDLGYEDQVIAGLVFMPQLAFQEAKAILQDGTPLGVLS